MNNKYFTPITELPGDSGKSESAAAMVRYNRSTSPHKYAKNQPKQTQKDEYFQKIMTVEQPDNSLFTPIASQQTIKKSAKTPLSSKYVSPFANKYAPQQSNVIRKSMSGNFQKTKRTPPGGGGGGGTPGPNIVDLFFNVVIDLMDSAGTSLPTKFPDIPTEAIKTIARDTGYSYRAVQDKLNEEGVFRDYAHRLATTIDEAISRSTPAISGSATPATSTSATSSSAAPPSIRGAQAKAFLGYIPTTTSTGKTRYTIFPDILEEINQAQANAMLYVEPVSPHTVNHAGPYENMLDWAERPENSKSWLAAAINSAYKPEHSALNWRSFPKQIVVDAGLLGGPVAAQNAIDFTRNLLAYTNPAQAATGINQVKASAKNQKYVHGSGVGKDIQDLAAEMYRDVIHAYDEGNPVAARNTARQWADRAYSILSSPDFESFKDLNKLKLWWQGVSKGRQETAQQIDDLRRLMRISGDAARRVDNPPIQSDELKRRALITTSILGGLAAPYVYNYFTRDDDNDKTSQSSQNYNIATPTPTSTTLTQTSKPLDRNSSVLDIINADKNKPNP